MTFASVLTNRTRAWGFIQSEDNAFISRDRVTIDGSTGGVAPGTIIFAGTLLGMQTVSGKYVPSGYAETDGSQFASCILGEDVTVQGDVVVGVFARRGEVRDDSLVYDPSVYTPGGGLNVPGGVDYRAVKWAQLASLHSNGFGGIIVRLAGGVQVTEPGFINPDP